MFGSRSAIRRVLLFAGPLLVIFVAERLSSATRNSAELARGKCLVEQVGMRGNCHSPRNPRGKPNHTRWLAGARLDLNGLCYPRCGARLVIENGRAIELEGDPDHSISRGLLCARDRPLLAYLYRPSRLKGDAHFQKGPAAWPSFVPGSVLGVQGFNLMMPSDRAIPTATS